MPMVCTDSVGSRRMAPSKVSRRIRPRARERTSSATSSEASTAPSRSNQATGLLDVEAELDDVAVLHHVVLALDAQLADVARLGPRAELEQLVPVHDLGLDEATLEVAVDDAGALRCLVAGAERPRPRLLLPRREEGPQPEQPVRGVQQSRHRTFAQS